MIRRELRKFVDETGMTPSRLGRNAVNCSKIVFEVMASNRTPRQKTLDRLREYMAEYRALHGE